MRINFLNNELIGALIIRQGTTKVKRMKTPMILILPFQNIETSQIQMILALIGKQQDSKVETAQTEGFHTYSLSSSSHLSL